MSKVSKPMHATTIGTSVDIAYIRTQSILSGWV